MNCKDPATFQQPPKLFDLTFIFPRSRGLKLHIAALAQGLAKCFAHSRCTSARRVEAAERDACGSAEVRKGCVFVYVELYKVTDVTVCCCNRPLC